MSKNNLNYRLPATIYMFIRATKITYTPWQVHNHYWETVLCRVPETLPSAFYRGTRQSNILPSAALGKIKHSVKVTLPSAKHSVKPGSRQNWALPSATALSKRWPARDGGHLPSDFAECLTADTRQFFFLKNIFCRVPAHGTQQFFFKIF